MAKKAKKQMQNKTSRTMWINGRRTSLRLCSALWAALEDIATKEQLTVRLLVEKVDIERGHTGLTIALRIFALSYLRIAAEDYFGNKITSTKKSKAKESALQKLAG